MPVKYKPRPPTVAICPVCGKQAIGRKGIKFDTNACKQVDKRRRQKEGKIDASNRAEA